MESISAEELPESDQKILAAVSVSMKMQKEEKKDLFHNSMLNLSNNGVDVNEYIDEIQENEIILDIGPKTIKNVEDIIDQSNTVLWNGPAGYFENKNFSIGTISIANKISENTKKKSLISVLGGGDTLSAVQKSKNKFSFTHLSTAGGAFLEFLEGKDLPGLNVLK